MHDTIAIEGGFADPVIAGQRAFKAVMDALARPGTIQRLPNEARPPAPLPQGLAEIALTLCDHDSPVWLDAGLVSENAVCDWPDYPGISLPGGRKIVSSFRAVSIFCWSAPRA